MEYSIGEAKYEYFIKNLAIYFKTAFKFREVDISYSEMAMTIHVKVVTSQGEVIVLTDPFEAFPSKHLHARMLLLGS